MIRNTAAVNEILLSVLTETQKGAKLSMTLPFYGYAIIRVDDKDALMQDINISNIPKNILDTFCPTPTREDVEKFLLSYSRLYNKRLQIWGYMDDSCVMVHMPSKKSGKRKKGRYWLVPRTAVEYMPLRKRRFPVLNENEDCVHIVVYN